MGRSGATIWPPGGVVSFRGGQEARLSFFLLPPVPRSAATHRRPARRREPRAIGMAPSVSPLFFPTGRWAHGGLGGRGRGKASGELEVAGGPPSWVFGGPGPVHHPPVGEPGRSRILTAEVGHRVFFPLNGAVHAAPVPRKPRLALENHGSRVQKTRVRPCAAKAAYVLFLLLFPLLRPFSGSRLA